MTQGRSRALAVLAFLAVVLVLTAPGALGSRDLYVGDIGHFEQPRDELVAQRLHEGEGLPRWLPGVWGGAPALGGQELALFYPPNDLLLLVAPERALVWGLALHLVLAALGARALARRLGAGEGASLVSGLVYGFGGAAVAMNAVPVYARSAGWLPWAVLGLVRASAGETRRGLVLAVLALLGTYLGGDPLGCAFAAGLALLVVLVRPGAGSFAARARVALPVTLAAGALTGLLGAIQLVPAVLATGESVRALGMTYKGATEFSLRPVELVGLLVPFAFGSQAAPETAWLEAWTHERPWVGAEVLYVGPIALALVALALFPRGQTRRRDDALLRSGLVVFSLFTLLALGRWTPLYRVFHALPGAGLFRYPAKLCLQASLGLALVAASGAQALVNDTSGKLRQRSLHLLGGLGALALVATNVLRLGSDSFAGWIDGLGSSELSGKEAVSALAWRLAHVAFVALGGLALAASAHPRVAAWLREHRLRPVSSRRLVLGLAVLVAVDLALACAPALIWGPREEVHRPPAVAATLAECAHRDGSPARVYPTFAARSETEGDVLEATARAQAGGPALLRDEGLLPNKGLAQGVLSQHGFLSNAPLRISLVGERADSLRREKRLSAAQDAVLRGARYVLVRADEVASLAAETSPVAAVPGGRELRHLEGAPPWAAVYSRAHPVPGIQEALSALGERDPRHEVVLEGSPPPLEEASVSGATVRLVGSFTPERFDLAVETPSRGWLVVREAYARGWRATVGGQPAEIFPADVAFRAVLVPQGSSQVVFEYEAPGARLGLALAVISGLASLATFFLNRRVSSTGCRPSEGK